MAAYVADKMKNSKFAVLDIKLMLAGQAIQPDGTVILTLKLDTIENIKDAKRVAVFRLNEDTNEIEELGISEVKDGEFSFKTNHFSTYLFVDASDNAQTDDEDSKADGNTQTGDETSAIPFAVAAVGAVVALAIAARKKKTV